MVQRRRAQSHNHFAGSGDRVGPLLDGEPVDIFENSNFHLLGDKFTSPEM